MRPNQHESLFFKNIFAILSRAEVAVNAQTVGLQRVRVASLEAVQNLARQKVHARRRLLFLPPGLLSWRFMALACN